MGVLPFPREEHRYDRCDDDECERFACRVYREGYTEGYEVGHGAGYGAGRADGYSEGYADGAADASDGG